MNYLQNPGMTLLSSKDYLIPNKNKMNIYIGSYSFIRDR